MVRVVLLYMCCCCLPPLCVAPPVEVGAYKRDADVDVFDVHVGWQIESLRVKEGEVGGGG